jgi:hypothetical protein
LNLRLAVPFCDAGTLRLGWYRTCQIQGEQQSENGDSFHLDFPLSREARRQFTPLIRYIARPTLAASDLPSRALHPWRCSGRLMRVTDPFVSWREQALRRPWTTGQVVSSRDGYFGSLAATIRGI